MARILLLDTNIASAPLYERLVARGHEVAPVGANPADFLARTCAGYQATDYSDAPAVAALAERLSADIILPGCNDRSYRTCAELAPSPRIRGVDPLDVVLTLNDKARFRRYAADRGLPSPRPWTAAAAADAGRPLIVKPADAFSGRGVTILRRPDAATVAAALAVAQGFSASGGHVIEDFVEGDLFSHSAFVAGGRIVLDFLVEEHCTANPFTVDTSRVRRDFPAAGLSQVREAIGDLVADLRLTDGLAHTQFLWDGARVSLVEITRRCPGDLYSLLISLSTGTPYADLYCRPFLGEALDPPPLTASPRHILRHTVSTDRDRVLGGLSFHAPLTLVKWLALERSGQPLRASPFGRAALMFAECGTATELDTIYRLATTRQLYSLTDGPSL